MIADLVPLATIPPAGRTDDAATVNEIAERFKDGDLGAYDELYTRVGPKIEKHISDIVNDGERAKELAQDVWVKVLTKWCETRDDSHFLGWVFQAATNRALDHLRKGTSAAAEGGRVRWLNMPDHWAGRGQVGSNEDRSSYLTLPRQLVLDETPETIAVRAEGHAQAGGMAGLLVEMLPRAYRLILWLYEWRGYSYEQIAVALKITVPAVKSRLYRVREAQRVLWERDQAYRRRSGRGVEERLWGYLIGGRTWALAHPDECWLWTGGLTGAGSGQPTLSVHSHESPAPGTNVIPRHQLVARRLAYVLVRAPLPPWAVVTPCSQSRRCINPAHTVPARIGSRRGMSPPPGVSLHQPCDPEIDAPASATTVSGLEAPPHPGIDFKRRRLRLGLYQDEVGRVANAGRRTIGLVEQGRLLNPHYIHAVSAALDALELQRGPAPAAETAIVPFAGDNDEEAYREAAG